MIGKSNVCTNRIKGHEHDLVTLMFILNNIKYDVVTWHLCSHEHHHLDV
jgi:hypothetical protein